MVKQPNLVDEPSTGISVRSSSDSEHGVSAELAAPAVFRRIRVVRRRLRDMPLAFHEPLFPEDIGKRSLDVRKLELESCGEQTAGNDAAALDYEFGLGSQEDRPHFEHPCCRWQSDVKDAVNARIKHREQFRPFAGAVPLGCAGDYFDIKGASPYMQFVLPVVESAQPRIPAIVHHGTCRVQTVAEEDDPIFHRLLRAFGSRTGIPVLLNTSFNDADEPIVCSPDHAIATFLRTDLDALALGPFLVTKHRE